MTVPDAVAREQGVVSAPIAPISSVVRRRTVVAAALRRHAFMMVMAFWWTATGVLYALQRNAWTRSLALVCAAGAVVVAARLLSVSREDQSAVGAMRAFFSGALAWSAIITLFFEGWVVGPSPESLGSATRGWEGALSAIAATSYWETLALLTIGAMALAVRRSSNKLALWTLLLFWGAHQSAKLNLFFGVVNSGAEIFPPYLAHLVRYFGPTVNSPLLPFTIVAYVVLALWMLAPWRRCDEGSRMRRMVIAALAGLAAVEHGLLATRLPIMLWELFLRIGRA